MTDPNLAGKVLHHAVYGEGPSRETWEQLTQEEQHQLFSAMVKELRQRSASFQEYMERHPQPIMVKMI